VTRIVTGRRHKQEKEEEVSIDEMAQGSVEAHRRLEKFYIAAKRQAIRHVSKFWWSTEAFWDTPQKARLSST
jgi:hypothetical protein